MCENSKKENVNMKTPSQEENSILIVEDSPTQAEQLRYLLDQNGYHITVATNGRQALDLISQHKPDLVISDITMPEMNGYELCQNIKACESISDIPVVLLTALTNPQDVMEGLACGADSFITKPYDKEYLLARIQKTLADWKLRTTESVHMGVEIQVAGKRRFIAADQQQMLGLLLSTYEAAVQRNNELVQAQEELNVLNEQLEKRVRERTASLLMEISERKLIEKALRVSEEQLSFVTNHAPVSIAHCDRHLRYKFVNKPYAEMNGLLPSDIIGKHMQDVISKENYAIASPYLKITLAGQVTEYDIVNQTTSTKLNAIHVSNAPEFNKKGNIEGFVAAITDISDRINAEAEIRKRLGELEVLYASSLTTSQMLQPKEIGRKILDFLAERLGWHHLAICLYQPNSQKVELLAYEQIGLEKEKDRMIAEDYFKKTITQSNQGIRGWVFQNGQLVYVNDVSEDERYIETWPGIHSGLYVPLKTGDRTIGCLSIESEQLNAFTESDEWLTTTLASQIAGVLENARLFEETNRRLSYVQALHKIDRSISNIANINITLEILLEQVIQNLNVHATDIWMLDPVTQRLDFACGRGFHTPALPHIHLRLGESLAGRAAVERQLIHISDLNNQSSSLTQEPHFIDEKFVECYAVPLIAKGLVIGVLEVFLRSPLDVDQEWLDFMQTLAGQSAIAIENITLINDLQNSKFELLQAYDATIEGWSGALDLRDKETEGHAQRVTEMTINLARVLHMDEGEMIHIRRGALLHDIGKIGIPDEILHKPGALSDEEWKIMRKHPKFAFDLLSSISYLHTSLEIPYCHHEKWDGSGYPRGLKGEEIPKAARIFAVVDVWDALISDRPYRKAWSKVKALEHIKEQSGHHFDPQIVEAFLRLVKI